MSIKRALISVSDKTGIVEFAKFLASKDIEIISTGGTAKILSENNVKIKEISQYTGFPEMMDGRVKTLHPKVHGGLLSLRDNKNHVESQKAHDIGDIDLVVVNLYPFEQTVAKGAEFEEIIENIDIGGPSMVRSAAKNYKFVTIITDFEDYAEVQKQIEENNNTSLDFRKNLAAKAFARTASYDGAISNWFATVSNSGALNISAKLKQELRYGENPHQKASFYKSSDEGIAAAKQLQGKELSYNNINDSDAAIDLVSEFEEAAAVIIKHANPCGVAIAEDINEAYVKALAADPVSAFGGIVALNRPINADLANELAKIFLEVIIATDITDEAKEILNRKKNLRVLILNNLPSKDNKSQQVKTIHGGYLVQERDWENTKKEDLECKTFKNPSEQEVKDMLFAMKICKHVKSNAIVLAKDNAITGIGAGQTSRVDSVRIAVKQAGEDAKGSVIASDAFFPFADGLEIAIEAGVIAAIQPGGSVRDDEVIDAANKGNISMVFTGKRYFRH